jgi:hypothetical protein
MHLRPVVLCSHFYFSKRLTIPIDLEEEGDCKIEKGFGWRNCGMRGYVQE